MTGRIVPLVDVPDLDGYGWANLRWLRRLVYERGLHHFKVVGRVMIDLDDLDRLVADGERNGDEVTEGREAGNGSQWEGSVDTGATSDTACDIVIVDVPFSTAQVYVRRWTETGEYEADWREHPSATWVPVMTMNDGSYRVETVE